jgi:phosphohistidine phosphatase
MKMLLPRNQRVCYTGGETDCFREALVKLLTLFRHAKSVQDPAFAVDRDRPLAPRGREDAPLIGRMMLQAGLMPQWIVSSPALRTRQTAELFAKAAEYGGEIRFHEAIYLGAAPDLLDVVLALPEQVDHAMLVGHNPGCEEFAALLLGAPPDAPGLRMPTAAAAHFELTANAWAEVGAGGAALQWLVIPRLIKKL